MISPYESFETWKAIFEEVTCDPESVFMLIPGLQALLTETAAKGAFPEQIQDDYQDFIENFCPRLLKSIFAHRITELDQKITLIDFVHSLISTSIVALNARKPNLLPVITEFFYPVQPAMLRIVDELNKRNLCTYLSFIGGVEALLEYVESDEKDKTTPFHLLCLIDSIDQGLISRYAQVMTKEIAKYCQDSNRSVLDMFFPVLVTILKGKEVLSTNISTFDELTVQWTNIALELIKREQFDSTQHGLALASIIFALPNINQTLTSMNAKGIILSVEPHTGYNDVLSECYKLLVKNSILDMEDIKNLWNKQVSLHSSDLEGFYEILKSISSVFPENLMPEFVETICSIPIVTV